MNGVWKLPNDFKEPILLRAAVAKILNCTPLTISNREAKGIYSSPVRDEKNSYRQYTVLDVFRMQYRTYGQVFLQPVMSVLFDKGYTDLPTLKAYIDSVMILFQKEISATIVTTNKV